MTRVLITGVGSYIGMCIAQHLSACPDAFEVRELDVKKPFAEGDFADFEAVVHVAGIAHRKETAENAPLYQQVNCDLTVQIARMAQKQGVRQFIFFSSMSVYGMVTGRITPDTKPAPNTYYGQSKWAAEQALTALDSESFRVAVLRPPMIYGRGCRGNYPKLSVLAQSLPIFPKVNNERSMLYVGTLCVFVQRLLESGLYFPQNRDYVNTGELVQCIAACHGRKLRLVPGFDRALRALSVRANVAGKVLGSLTYDQQMSGEFRDENELAFEQTVMQTEVGE